MKIDVNKAVEVAAQVQEFGNKKPLEMLSNCASLIAGMSDNPYKDAIVEAFTKIEAYYNEEYLGVLSKNNKVLLETLPEFKKAIETAGMNISVVNPNTISVKTKDIDMGSMSLL